MTRIPWHGPARRVLGQVRYAGMRWHVRDGRLYLTGNTDALTDAHRAAIDRHRPQLVAILEALPARCVVPHMCCVIGPCDPDHCRQASAQGARQSEPARPQQEGRDAALPGHDPAGGISPTTPCGPTSATAGTWCAPSMPRPHRSSMRCAAATGGRSC